MLYLKYTKTKIIKKLVRVREGVKMFKNTKELRNLIKQGKSNEEIIKEQLEYLNSDEYKNNRKKTIKKGDSDAIIFHDGYISPDMNVANEYDRLVAVSYYYNDASNEIYNSVINFIRDNMNKEGFSIFFMMELIKNYFSIKENSKYKKLYDIYKQAIPKKPYLLRSELPYIIQEYKNSTFDGDIVDFGIAYLYDRIYSTTKAEKYKNAALKYRASVNFDELDDTIRLNLTDIKDAGIAACTEFAFLEQNILSFLGVNVYMLGGKLIDGQKEEGHNFNVVEIGGTFMIIDTATNVFRQFTNITSLEELINLKNFRVVNQDGKIVNYSIGLSNSMGSKHK